MCPGGWDSESRGPAGQCHTAPCCPLPLRERENIRQQGSHVSKQLQSHSIVRVDTAPTLSLGTNEHFTLASEHYYRNVCFSPILTALNKGFNKNKFSYAGLETTKVILKLYYAFSFTKMFLILKI